MDGCSDPKQFLSSLKVHKSMGLNIGGSYYRGKGLILGSLRYL